MIKNLFPKLAEIGRIKTGKLGSEHKTRDGKSTYRLPTRLNHFLITTNERDNTGNFAPDLSLMEKIAEQTGEDPGYLTTIPVVLLYDDIDSNLYTTYVAYKGRTLMCQGDGETAIVRASGEERSCPCERLEQDYKGPVKCKIFGRLQVVIQDMDIIGGIWAFRTTSWNSTRDLMGSMILISRIAGRLAGIPLMLKLTPKTVILPTGQATVYTTTLLYQGSPKALIDAAGKIPMIGHENVVLDQTITSEEEAEVQEEFYPPTGAEEDTAANIAEQVKKKKKNRSVKTKTPEKTAAELAQGNKKTQAPEPPEKEFPESPIDTIMQTAKEEKTKAQTKTKALKQAQAQAKTQPESEKEKPPATAQEEKEPVVDEPPSIEEGEILDEPASNSDFGWV